MLKNYLNKISPKKMELPIWFKVKSRQISFPSIFEEENLPKELIFMLGLIWDHPVYIEGYHILKKIIDLKKVENYIYLYSLIHPDWASDSQLESTSLYGDFTSYLIRFEYFLVTVKRLAWKLLSFLDIGPLTIDIKPFDPLNFAQLEEILNFEKEFYESNLIFSRKTVKKIWKIKCWHETIKEILLFFKGEKFPSCLKNKRKEIFEKLVYQWWPAPLSTLKPFSPEEEKIIEEAHKKLYKEGSMEFIEWYVEEFGQKIGGSLFEKLVEKNKSSPETDAERIMVHLKDHPSEFNWAGFTIKLSQKGIQNFADAVKKEGFEIILLQNLRKIWQPILAEINSIGGQIQNVDLISTSEPFWYYLLNDLLIHEEDGNYYFFLKSELPSFPVIDDWIVNPYTRKKIGPILEYEKREVKSLEEYWSRVLRRKINLSEFVLNSE